MDHVCCLLDLDVPNGCTPRQSRKIVPHPEVWLCLFFVDFNVGRDGCESKLLFKLIHFGVRRFRLRLSLCEGFLESRLHINPSSQDEYPLSFASYFFLSG